MTPSNRAPQVAFLPALGPSAQDVEIFLQSLEAASASGSYIALNEHNLNLYLNGAQPACGEACKRRIEKHKGALLLWPHPNAKTDTDTDVLWPKNSGESQEFARDRLTYGNSAGGLLVTTSMKKDSTQPNPSTFCGLPVEYKFADAVNKPADMGGNVLALPNGTCLVGSQMTKEYKASVCGPGAKVVELETLTNLPHIDNGIGILPGPPPCGARIAVASPDRMKEFLRAHPDEKFFEDKSDVKPGRGKVVNPYWQICDQLDAVYYLREVRDNLSKMSPDDGGEKAPADATSRWGWFSSQAYAGPSCAGGECKKISPGIVSRPSKPETSGPEKFSELKRFNSEYEGRTKRSCTEYSNRQVLALMEGKEDFSDLKSWAESQAAAGDSAALKNLQAKIAGVEGVAAGNAEYQKSQDANWKKIYAALPPECRNDPGVRVDMPQLQLNRDGVNPNPTNFQRVGNLVIYPQQFNKSLQAEIEKVYTANGMKAIAQDTKRYHAGRGNVHCTTNEIRLCQP